MSKLLRKLWMDESGQDVAEYALMLALILAVSVIAVRALGVTASGIFDAANTALGG